MSEDTIAFDSVLDLCQNQHRRIVLGALANDQPSLPVNELMEVILKYNHQLPPQAASEPLRTEIRLSLHHSHLPKLADHSLIEYGPDRQQVEPTPQFDQVEPHLSWIIEADPDLEAPVTL